MKAIRPDSPHRRSLAARGALATASMTVLLLVAAFSLITTGCSDDSNDAPCCADTGTDAGGLGGQTYTASTPVGSSSTVLVLVTRGGGSSAPASTAGMLADDLAAGPVDGVLAFENGLREILTGVYDPEVASGSNLIVSSLGGVTFEGNATPTFFSGTLKVKDIANVPNLVGNGGQEDAPLIHLLGTWEHSTEIVANCGGLGQYSLTCAGFTRIRKVGRSLRMDIYESCGDEPYECTLSGSSLSDGMWSGLDYSEPADSSRNIGGCSVAITGDRGMSVNTQMLSSSTIGTVRFTNSACLPANTVCPFEQTMTATRCIDCWPLTCDDGF